MYPLHRFRGEEEDIVCSAQRFAERGRNDRVGPQGSVTLVGFEDFYGGRYARVAAAYNNTDDAVTLTVTGAGSSSAYIFTVGDVIKNARTGENMVVATIAGATSLTAGRAFGTTVKTAGLAGDGLFIVGNVNEENSGARNVNATESSKQSNYTQIFKTTIALSDTEREANLYGGRD